VRFGRGLHLNFPTLHLRVAVHSFTRGPLRTKLSLQESPHLLPKRFFLEQMICPLFSTAVSKPAHVAAAHLAFVLLHDARPVQVIFFSLPPSANIQPFLPLILQYWPNVVPPEHENSQPRIAGGGLQSIGAHAEVEPLQDPSCLHMRAAEPRTLYPYLHENLQEAPYRILDATNAPLLPRHFISPLEGLFSAAHFTLVHLAATPVQVPISVQMRVGDPERLKPFRQPYSHLLPSVSPSHFTEPLRGRGGSTHFTFTHLVSPLHFPFGMHFTSPLPGGRKPAGHWRVHVFPISVPNLQLITAPFSALGSPQLTGLHSAKGPDHAPFFMQVRCLLFALARVYPVLQAKLQVFPTVVPFGQSAYPFGGSLSLPQSLGLQDTALPLH